MRTGSASYTAGIHDPSQIWSLVDDMQAHSTQLYCGHYNLHLATFLGFDVAYARSNVYYNTKKYIYQQKRKDSAGLMWILSPTIFRMRKSATGF